MGLLGNRDRHIRLEDDGDVGGGESSSALLPHSKKTALRALFAQISMVLSLVGCRRLCYCCMLLAQ